MTLLRPLIRKAAGEIIGVFCLKRNTSETGDLGRSLGLNQYDLIALEEKQNRLKMFSFTFFIFGLKLHPLLIFPPKYYVTVNLPHDIS